MENLIVPENPDHNINNINWNICLTW